MEEKKMEQNKELKKEKVKTSSAVFLGAANASTGLLCAFAEGSAFQYLFVQKLGLRTDLNLIVMILFGIWNALNDPIYGFLADHTKSKLGTRRPWIRYGAPVMAVLFALMWISFPNMKGVQWFLFIQEFLGLFLFDIVYTAIASAIYVMPYEMAVTNKARNKIFLWNIAFSVISYGAPMVLNSFLDPLLKGNYQVFALVMAGMGLLCGAIVFVSTFFYKENGYVQVAYIYGEYKYTLSLCAVQSTAKSEKINIWSDKKYQEGYCKTVDITGVSTDIYLERDYDLKQTSASKEWYIYIILIIFFIMFIFNKKYRKKVIKKIDKKVEKNVIKKL
jgi:Na+/melibiose symporter-like transporter